MKRNTITALLTSALLAGTAGWAAGQEGQEAPPRNDKSKDSSPGTAEKIQQGAKNIFTELKFEDLPPAVQNAVREKARSMKIADIDREDRTGRTIYEIEFETDGPNREVHVAADGTLLTEEQASLQLGYDRDTDRTRVREKSELEFGDLPPSVQAAVQKQGSADQIADIDTYRRQGKLFYEVEFRRDGPDREIHVSEEGKLIDVDAWGAPGKEKDATKGEDRSNLERRVPPSGNGTVPNPTLPPTDVK